MLWTLIMNICANVFLGLEQVETLLKTQDPALPTPDITPTSFTAGQSSASGVGLGAVPANDFNLSTPTIGLNGDRWGFNGESPQPGLDPMAFSTDLNMGMNLDDSTFTWEMIGLGLEEPLPPQDTIDELYVNLPQLNLFRMEAYLNAGIKFTSTKSTLPCQ
jgi:hypothetical protein